jgi:serine/threonine protein kinase
MNKYNYIKKIGNGLYGTTFEVEYNDVKYALKKQKILEKDIEKNLNLSIWREIEFYKWINNLNETDKKYFMKLYDWNFEENCELEQERSFSNKLLKDLDKSNYCLNLIVDLKDGTLDKLNLKEDESKSLLIQILYAIYLLRKSGWIHGDIHPGNIGYKKIDYDTMLKAKINNKTYKFKSYGYQFSLIDYGGCINKKFMKSKKEKKKYSELYLMNFDLWCFIEDYALNNYKNGIILRENKINTKKFHKDLLEYVYKNNRLLYEKIKFIMKDSKKLFNKFEKKIYFIELSYDFSHYVQIYEPELYYSLLKIKEEENKYSKDLLEYIKLNKSNIEKILLFLIQPI